MAKTGRPQSPAHQGFSYLPTGYWLNYTVAAQIHPYLLISPAEEEQPKGH